MRLRVPGTPLDFEIGGPPSGVDERAYQLMRAHHLNSDAIETIVASIAEIRRRTRVDREWAAVVRIDTGKRIGPFVKGSAIRTDISKHLEMLVLGRAYVQIHSHPLSESFSPQDAVTLHGSACFKTMIVIGLDGTLYVMTKDRGHPQPRLDEGDTSFFDELVDTIAGALNALQPKYDGLVAERQLSEAAARRLHTHEAWEQVAPQLRFRYDRLEPEKKEVDDVYTR